VICRVKYLTSIITVKCLTGIIYPVVTHWQWGGGFLVKGIDYGGDIGRLGYTVNKDS
jgi:ammonia channel protein AmtB